MENNTVKTLLSGTARVEKNSTFTVNKIHYCYILLHPLAPLGIRVCGKLICELIPVG